MKISANVFTKSNPDLGSNGWAGDNLTSDPLGFDSPDGVALGLGEFGGIRHFLNRTKVTVSHK